MQVQKCLKHRSTVCGIQIMQLVLMFSFVGGFFFRLEWWWRAGGWFDIAPGLPRTVNKLLTTSWASLIVLSVFLITLYWCATSKAKRTELILYAVITGLVAALEFITTTMLLSKSISDRCEQIWSEFDRVKDQNPTWILYRKHFLYTDDTSDEQALLIYDAWKYQNCYGPARIVAGFFGVEWIAGVIIAIYTGLSLRRSQHVPLDVREVESAHLLGEPTNL